MVSASVFLDVKLVLRRDAETGSGLKLVLRRDAETDNISDGCLGRPEMIRVFAE
jgi:hypothetical protein